MNSEKIAPFRLAVWLCLIPIVGVVQSTAVAGDPGDYYMEARLVWATNGGKPADSNLKDLPPEFTKKFKSVFAWEDYYEVKSYKKAFIKGKLEKLKMSEKCRLEILFKEDDEVEIRLFGEDKPLAKRKQKVVKGEMIVMGGDCKGTDNAWFVVLKPIEEKDLDKKE